MSMIKSSFTTFGGWLNWECDWTILSANVPIFWGNSKEAHCGVLRVCGMKRLDEMRACDILLPYS